MTVNELLQKTRNTLQDQEKNFWDDSELLDYYEEGRRVIASERTEKLLTQTIVLSPATDLYAPIGVLRYISIKDDEGTVRPLYPNDGSGTEDTMGITVIEYDQIEVHDDTVGSTLSVKYLGLPLDHNLNDTVRQGDETTLKYYMLSKAYEKETEMENFAKADKFKFEFKDLLSKLVANKSMGYSNTKENTTTSYQY